MTEDVVDLAEDARFVCVAGPAGVIQIETAYRLLHLLDLQLSLAPFRLLHSHIHWCRRSLDSPQAPKRKVSTVDGSSFHISSANSLSRSRSPSSSLWPTHFPCFLIETPSTKDAAAVRVATLSLLKGEFPGAGECLVDLASDNQARFCLGLDVEGSRQPCQTDSHVSRTPHDDQFDGNIAYRAVQSSLDVLKQFEKYQDFRAFDHILSVALTLSRLEMRQAIQSLFDWLQQPPQFETCKTTLPQLFLEPLRKLSTTRDVEFLCGQVGFSSRKALSSSISDMVGYTGWVPTVVQNMASPVYAPAHPGSSRFGDTSRSPSSILDIGGPSRSSGSQSLLGRPFVPRPLSFGAEDEGVDPEMLTAMTSWIDKLEMEDSAFPVSREPDPIFGRPALSNIKYPETSGREPHSLAEPWNVSPQLSRGAMYPPPRGVIESQYNSFPRRLQLFLRQDEPFSVPPGWETSGSRTPESTTASIRSPFEESPRIFLPPKSHSTPSLPNDPMASSTPVSPKMAHGTVAAEPARRGSATDKPVQFSWAEMLRRNRGLGQPAGAGGIVANGPSGGASSSTNHTIAVRSATSPGLLTLNGGGLVSGVNPPTGFVRGKVVAGSPGSPAVSAVSRLNSGTSAPVGNAGRAATTFRGPPPRSKDPLKPGDWICPNPTCRYHNFARRTTCVACGTNEAGRV